MNELKMCLRKAIEPFNGVSYAEKIRFLLWQDKCFITKRKKN